MQTITLSKINGGRYDVRRNGQVVGTVGQDLRHKWAILEVDFNRVFYHTPIKAAVRAAARAL